MGSLWRRADDSSSSDEEASDSSSEEEAGAAAGAPPPAAAAAAGDAAAAAAARVVDVPGAAGLLLFPAPSLTQVLRAVRRAEHSIFSAVASVALDARFVAAAASRAAGLPALANLRCGGWYLPAPDATCYFKSTDGHAGQWAFSLARLNLPAARLAAARGGAVLVDATRRGKTFPDALAKTVPLWAAVLNGAVAAVRVAARARAGDGGRATNGAADSGAAGAGPAAATEPEEWDTDVHLPPWIDASEAAQIAARAPAAVAALLALGADLAPLAAALKRPLRCAWAAQGDGGAWRGWPGAGDVAEDAPLNPAALPFTPLLCVSASAPARARRRLVAPAPGGGGAPIDVQFDYIPGAGDDEEGWARGLTPGALWAAGRWADILRAGPGGADAAAARAAAAHAARLRRGNAPAGGDEGAEAGGAGDADSGAVRWVGDTRLGLCQGDAAAAAPGVWAVAGAVLSLARAAPPGMAAEPATALADGAGAPGAPRVLRGVPTRYLRLPLPPAKADRHALRAALPAAVAFASAHLAAGRTVLMHAEPGAEGLGAGAAALLAVLVACFTIEDDAPGGRRALRWRGAAAVDAASGAPRPAAPQVFGRAAVRAYLAALAPALPDARPGQGALRAVFNSFLADAHRPRGATPLGADL
jgi:tRNA A64-2'-O-ribosylphosphate transferase